MNAQLIKFEVKEMPQLCMLGKEIVVKMDDLHKHNPVPEFRNKCMEEKLFDKILEELADYVYDPSYVDYMQMLNEDEFTNVCGILMKPGVPVFNGYIAYNIDTFTAGVGWIQGTEPDIYVAEHNLTAAAMDKAGYKYDTDRGFSIEVYNSPRYTEADELGNRIIDYYIPIIKK